MLQLIASHNVKPLFFCISFVIAKTFLLKLAFRKDMYFDKNLVKKLSQK